MRSSHTPILRTLALAATLLLATSAMASSYHFRFPATGVKAEPVAPTVQIFTSDGTFKVPAGVMSVEVLVVAGGGAGGCFVGGGGGGGGLLYSAAYSVIPGSSVPVTVGVGGLPGTWTIPGVNGGNSKFGSLTAIGGGTGGCQAGYSSGFAAMAGGSGGGGTYYISTSGAAGTAGQGYPGGGGVNGTKGASAGGGGGAGAAGQNDSNAGLNAGAGGTGLLYDISGVPTYYAGGGGGGSYGQAPGGYNQPGIPGAGGLGGGGAGSTDNWGVGVPGTPNTGGGGGGAGVNGAGSAGGSGIVIVKAR